MLWCDCGEPYLGKYRVLESVLEISVWWWGTLGALKHISVHVRENQVARASTLLTV